VYLHPITRTEERSELPRTPRTEERQPDEAVDQAGELWTKCTGPLREQVSESTWQLWLSGLEPIQFADGVFVLSVPNGLIRERVETRYLPMIQDILSVEVGTPVVGRLEVHEVEAPEFLDNVEPSPSPSPDPGAGPPPRTRGPESPAVALDPKFVFETFVAASSNRLAHAAAQAVAETPGRSYNPLFIYGDSGLGKTHLLHAIGNYVSENFSRRKVLYVTTETFMNDFVDSLRTSTTLAFKRRYRECDVLLIDDVQFMENKEGLQEEFFHTYNDLKGASKQIVLTSDRPPKSIASLEDRLRSRFLSGLITEINPPDLETRLAILRSKSDSERQEVPDDVLEFIATHVKSNIRELEGALTRISAFAKLNKEAISLAQAERVLSDIVLAGEPRRITPEMILNATAASYGFSVEAICGPSRTRPLVTARQVAMYLVRNLTDFSYPAIGRLFGGRDHTTVIHAVDKIEGQMQHRLQIYEQVTELTQQVRAGN
jgi:chromosomal replication initiator protein